MPTLLALETSCDESAAALVRDQRVLASAVASQVEEHARWGGVVPEIASRRHVEALPGLIERVLAESGVAMAELDAIAATAAPGLVGALLVGSVTGRTLARLHGGPAIEAAAAAGDPGRFRLPKGRVSLAEGGFHPYDFSFSGLKTAVLRLVQQLRAEQAAGGESVPIADVAASFEQVVAEVLVERTCRCARDQGLGTIVMVGGVAANRRLRSRFEQRCRELDLQWRVAPLAYCTDNAAMIGVAAEQRLLAGRVSSIGLAVAPRLALEDAAQLYAPQPPF
ncbi:MAG: tRNA (adenosine(37)-N6)-threonylcarbamoyltransferase complex transferase subunit TsaD [Synechococcaceae bacterium WB4_1_0192]|nr:tRNA (adenosine(37)-N6)-threonylcarbamoyltransferase complex transferase subunit TsaD [Synechococcaceae bacterium WB4_1_0192]